MTTPPILRPYQRRWVDDIYKSWRAGNRNVLGVLPTGGGKSVCVSEIVADMNAQKQRGTIIAHRNELVAQMSGHIARRGIWHRIIGPSSTVSQIKRANHREFGKSFIHDEAAISVAGVDTIVSRADRLASWALQQSFWITDESHHLLRNNKWGTAAGMMHNAIGLGVTASPVRADGQGLGTHADGVMQDMILGPNMRELIDEGALCDYDIAVAESDLQIPDDAIGATGDYSPAKLRKAAEKSHIVGDVVAEYIRLALGRRTICFATDVERANEIAAQFVAQGIPAAALSGKSNGEYRAEMLRRFRSGELHVLVNVDLFDEGFDVPDCEVVIMARPTMSLAKYLQQFGRALRPTPGKRALIIDHVGNWRRHGFPDRPHVWSLDRRERRSVSKRDPHDLTTCPGCGKPHELFHPVCPYCGWAPKPGSGATRDLQQIEGNLMLLDRDILEQMRKATLLEAPGDMAGRVAHVVGDMAGKSAANKQIAKIAAQSDLREAIATWAGIGRAAGKSDERLYREWYILTGMDVLSALSKDRTRAEYEATTAMVKEWSDG